MTGIFGIGASLEVDINLIIQIVSFLVLVFGLVYKTKKKFKMHGTLMGIAVILHLISFLTIMGPRFFPYLGDYVDYISVTESQTTLTHAISGAVALILGILLVVLWALKPANVAACSRRKRLMDITVLLWVISLLFGIVTYILVYTSVNI